MSKRGRIRFDAVRGTGDAHSAPWPLFIPLVTLVVTAEAVFVNVYGAELSPGLHSSELVIKPSGQHVDFSCDA